MTPTSKFFAAAFALLASCSCADNTPEKAPTNVILITMDTTRADYLSCYDYHRETTPNMDTLAKEGVMFTRAMSTSALTPVSHSSILTGLYQQEHGVRVMAAESGFTLAPDTQSFATVLKKRGYKLGAVHSSFPVSNHFGFDQGYDVFDSLEAEMITKPFPKFDGDGHPVLDPKTGKQVMYDLTFWETEGATRRSEATTDRSLAFVDSVDGPFFLWIHYWDPHDANVAPPDEFLNRQDMPKDKLGRYRRTDEFYAEEVRYVDAQIGRLLDGLRDRGLYRDALIILTADHGDGLTDGKKNHGWKAHRELYVEQLNVPLIFKFPAGTPGVTLGARVDQLVGTVDIFPTACHYLNLPMSRQPDGSSLRDLVEGNRSKTRLRYADQINGFDKNASMTDKRPEAMFIYALMNDDWKLIYRPTEEHPKELYHIAVDPRELKNVADANPDILDEMMIKLANTAGWVTAPFQPGGVEVKPLRTEGLGYVASDGDYAGTFEWTCPIGHELRATKNGECPTCNNPLVPIAALIEDAEDKSGEE